MMVAPLPGTCDLRPFSSLEPLVMNQANQHAISFDPISARCHSRQPPSERSRPPLQRAFPSPRRLSAGETGRKPPPEGDTLLRDTTPGLGQLTREADGHHPAVPRAFTLLFKRVSGGMAKRRPGKPAAPSRAVSKPTDLSAHNMWHAQGRP